ncbi:hypothetical protein [Allomuricauda sp. M10]|uniref:hypothetical protein n=1 Tax=Allomuricauda sp. M10 TaxID=2683292 RepID=UPI001D1845D9|nr:hypothetical protein [Muricauda sp. M10]
MAAKSYKEIYQDLVWPALAGNIIWSVFSVLVKNVENPQSAIFRFAALIALGVYVTYTYKKYDEGRGHPFDYFHAAAIIAYSIAVESNSDHMGWYTSILFLSASFGHWCGPWGNDCLVKCKTWRHILVGAIFIVGIVVYFVIPDSFCPLPNARIFLSILTVLILWAYLRNRIYYEWWK